MGYVFMAKMDSTTVYHELVEMLRDLGLNWVIRQVGETVIDGKTIEDKMPRRMYPALKIVDFSEAEKLLVLTEGITRSLVEITAIESWIEKFCQSSEIESEIVFYDAEELEDKAWHFTSDDLANRRKRANHLQSLLKRLQNAIIDDQIDSQVVHEIRTKSAEILNPHFQEFERVKDVFKLYIFSLVLTAAKNEGGIISYKNVEDHQISRLILRRTPSKIHGDTHLYTYGVIQFPNKPLLEVHLGVKLQGKSWILHECDLLVLHEQEAHLCRAKKREPRTSKVVLLSETSYFASTLKTAEARSFLGLVSDIRARGECYFITNTTSNAATKLLTMANKKWEHNIAPETNDVNRLIYSLQSIFKDFKARF